MISVQNLQQLLNGSKKICFLAIFCAFILSSCVTTRSGGNTSPWGNDSERGILRPSDDKQEEKQTENSQKNTKSNDKDQEKNKDKSSVNKDQKDKQDNYKPKKDTQVEKPDTIFQIVDKDKYSGGILTNYNVLVLLPFNVHKNSLDYNNKKIDVKSKVALEFYQGMMQSLRELQAEGMSFTIRVYDTRIDQYRTKSLLNSLQYEQIDLIVGPVYNKCLKEAAEWARVNKTYLISPIASNADFIQENPYYVAINPTMNAHVSKLAQYIKSERNVNRITIITNANSNKDSKLAQDIERQLNSYSSGIGDFNTSTSVNVIYDSKESETVWTDYLIERIDNHVIVASMDEAFSSDVIRRLSLMNRTYPVILYGMPNWKRYRNINIDMLEDLNFHLTAVSNTDKNDMRQQQMIESYKTNVGIKPSEFSKKGYDVSNYLFKSMDKYGADLMIALPRASMQSGCFMDFYVMPSRLFSGSTRYLENTAVKVLEFEDYEFRLVR